MSQSENIYASYDPKSSGNKIYLYKKIIIFHVFTCGERAWLFIAHTCVCV